jgi:outer membrane lipoprotein carrier protein
MILRSLLCGILLAGVCHGTCFALEAAEILHRVQQRYAPGNFRADFVQESDLRAMGMVDTAKGELLFGSPGTMRWHYQTPEEYFIITDGDTVWIYRPDDNQVIRGRAIDYFGGRKGSDFFSNPDALSKDFVVTLAPEELQREDYHVLKLVPKREQPDLAELYLSVSRSTYDITETVTSNAFGDKTTIRFNNYRFKQDLDPSLFHFKIPDGAEVLQLEGEEGMVQP